jgi:hypothetical protein
MVERYQRFEGEKRFLETDLAHKIAFISMRGDRELIRETWKNYSFMIPLNRDAVLSVRIGGILLVSDRTGGAFPLHVSFARPEALRCKVRRELHISDSVGG